jgi:hypothetical protein
MIGEEYLKGLGFGEKVSRLVGSHVAAKRSDSHIPTDGISKAADASVDI